MNVAEFRGLLAKPLRDIPIVVYLHENQLAYPNRFIDTRDLHFAFTNFTSCLAADAVWFNSEFNRQSMVDGLREQAVHWPDYSPIASIEILADAGKIQHPGLDIPDSWPGKPPALDAPLQITWAARWEHDKDPAGLLKVLSGLQAHQSEFELHIIGEQYSEIPTEFDTIKDQFESQISTWGYLPERTDYWRVLNQSDVIVSTAVHEFFGISVCEGLAAGLTAILPNRLAYPEIARAFSEPGPSRIWLYDSYDQATRSLLKAIRFRRQLREDRQVNSCNLIRDKLRWSKRGAELDLAVSEVILNGRST